MIASASVVPSLLHAPTSPPLPIPSLLSSPLPSLLSSLRAARMGAPSDGDSVKSRAFPRQNPAAVRQHGHGSSRGYPVTRLPRIASCRRPSGGFHRGDRCSSWLVSCAWITLDSDVSILVTRSSICNTKKLVQKEFGTI